jgi:hypothetical protein
MALNCPIADQMTMLTLSQVVSKVALYCTTYFIRIIEVKQALQQ